MTAFKKFTRTQRAIVETNHIMWSESIISFCSIRGNCAFSSFCSTEKFSVIRLNSLVPFPFSLAVSGINISSGTKTWILDMTFKIGKYVSFNFNFHSVNGSEQCKGYLGVCSSI